MSSPLRFGPVVYERDGDVAVITIDNPPVNALSQAVRHGLVEAMRHFVNDAQAKAAIMLGRGRAFIAGADISEFGRPPQPPMLPDVVAQIEESAKPVVAVLNGVALGGGLEVALGCHWRLALAGAQMGLPETTLGIMPGAGGTQRLPRLIGLLEAGRMISSAARVKAEDARALGLIDRLTDSGDPRAAGLAYAREGLAEGWLVARPTSARAIPDQGDAAAVEALKADAARRYKDQIAQVTALDTMIQGAHMPFAQAMSLERGRFLDLLASPQRAALVRAFFAERRAAQAPELRDIAPREITDIGVVGGGTMGAGIATACLLAGLSVTLSERDDDSAARARNSVQAMLEGAQKRGKISAQALAEMLETRFATCVDMAGFERLDLVIEAVFERLDVKRDVFARLDRVCRPGCVLATNTSYLDINAIAQATSRPEDVIGLHFFSPAHVMKLLEIVVPDTTAADVTATALALAKRLGKVPVLSAVADGFIGNRILRATRHVAETMVLDGASPYRVDAVLRDMGLAMGPFEVSDLAGLDIAWMNRQRETEAGKGFTRPPVFADRMVDEGRLGRKTGRGFYIYDAETPKGRPDPEMDSYLSAIRAELGLTPRDFTDADIRERYLAAMINEGAHLLGEGVARRASDIDVAKLFGYGFPRHLGGPMHLADREGAAVWLARVQSYAAEDPTFWRPAPLLAELAQTGESFADRDAATSDPA